MIEFIEKNFFWVILIMLFMFLIIHKNSKIKKLHQNIKNLQLVIKNDVSNKSLHNTKIKQLITINSKARKINNKNHKSSFIFPQGKVKVIKSKRQNQKEQKFVSDFTNIDGQIADFEKALKNLVKEKNSE